MSLRFIVEIGNFPVRAGNDPHGGPHHFQHLRAAYYGQAKAELAEGDKQGQIFPVILENLLAKGSICRMGEIGTGDEKLSPPAIQEQVKMKIYKIRYVIQGSRL